MYARLWLTGGKSPGSTSTDIPLRQSGRWPRWPSGAAASKGVPITVDTVQYYNRIVGLHRAWRTPAEAGRASPFVHPPGDPELHAPMSARRAARRGRTSSDYRRDVHLQQVTPPSSAAVTWLDVAKLKWVREPHPRARSLDHLSRPQTGHDQVEEVDGRTLTGVTAFAQMADDARAVINYLHEHDQVVGPGLLHGPRTWWTPTAQQIKNTTEVARRAAGGTPSRSGSKPCPFSADLLRCFNPWGGTLARRSPSAE